MRFYVASGQPPMERARIAERTRVVQWLRDVIVQGAIEVLVVDYGPPTPHPVLAMGFFEPRAPARRARRVFAKIEDASRERGTTQVTIEALGPDGTIACTVFHNIEANP